ncbi:MAG: C-terminal binding protein [Spirochaetales bacterium]|nr:C-terminal binding protein [Spirochaetales bacterium]
MNYKVLVTDDRHGFYHVERDILGKIGAELEVLPDGDPEALVDRLASADALLLNQMNLSASVIPRLKRCRIISRYGSGYDNVDVEAATAMGIWVSRVPDYCYPEVAEHALALLLAAVRHVPAIHTRILEGGWNLHSGLGMSRIRGKVLGIIGYGGTGRSFHHAASGLGFSRVLICDHRVTKSDIAFGEAEIVDFDTLIRQADIISLHIPFREENRHLINAAAISAMKTSAVLINTSRGGIVDTSALGHGLKTGQIAAAGIDVFEKEPPEGLHPLVDCENAVLSDHCAYYSEESIIELKEKAAHNVARVLCGEAPVYPVNTVDLSRIVLD